MIDRHPSFRVARRVKRVVVLEQVTLLSAAVAYYGFVSLVPLGLLTVALATATVGEELIAAQLTASADELLTPTAQELIVEAIGDNSGRRGATVVGILGLLWGSSRIFRGLDRAFSEIYGTVATKSFVDTMWDVLVVVTAIVLGLAILAVFETVIVVAPIPGVTVLGPVFVLLGLVVVFLPLYTVFPGPEIDVREALPGTLVAAVGWFALSRAFALYATFAGDYVFYGALGAVLLVLAWLYVASLVILLGATLNAVIAGRDMDRQLQSPGARQFAIGAMTDDATGRDEGPAGNREGSGTGADERAETTAGADATTNADTAASADTTAATSSRTRDRADDPEVLREEIERLRDRLESFEADVEDRTVDKPSLEADLKRYVRRRVRRGHATGWGPYLVLLYGTAMTVAAFYFLADSAWAAVAAMLVVWTSTLGVYVLMVLFGAGISLLGLPGRLRNAIGERRS
ncbi:YhjD/YihY/BrkB family envelope integrity protein [Natrialbaceae archaeon GCM10025810]|uniref:YihY/virulence factor BrkB family protein n=1 Tax=Halovalidus salilacus TaxID=3075124 RepID=UPI003621EE7F